MSRRSALHMTATDVVAHQSKHGFPPPVELAPMRGPGVTGKESALGAGALRLQPKRKGDRRLKKHRVPNALETEFGHKLQRDKQAGAIEDYVFEGVTLRWGDMEYTPDYFIIREERVQGDGRVFIEAVYVEIKGGHKWEDSIVKFKAFRARMKWATFEMWGKEKGRWVQLA